MQKCSKSTEKLVHIPVGIQIARDNDQIGFSTTYYPAQNHNTDEIKS